MGLSDVDVRFDSPLSHITGSRTFRDPVFNLEPEVGEPARFGFLVNGEVPVYLDTSVRTGGDYGVTVSVDNISQVGEFLGSTLTFWGVPDDPRHNNARGWLCLDIDEGAGPEGIKELEEEGVQPCSPLNPQHPQPFLDLPTSCTGPLQTSVEADSWKQPGVFTSTLPTEPMESQDGCNQAAVHAEHQGHAGWAGGEHPDGVDRRRAHPAGKQPGRDGFGGVDGEGPVGDPPRRRRAEPGGGGWSAGVLDGTGWAAESPKRCRARKRRRSGR